MQIFFASRKQALTYADNLTWYSEFLETRHIWCERSIENVAFLRILKTTSPVSEKLGFWQKREEPWKRG